MSVEYFEISRKLSQNALDKILYLEWENGVQLSSENKSKYLENLLNGNFFSFLEKKLEHTEFLEIRFMVESIIQLENNSTSNNISPSLLRKTHIKSKEELFYDWFDINLAFEGRRVYKLVEYYIERFYQNNSDLSLWDYISLFDSDKNIEKPLGSSEVQQSAFRFFRRCVEYQKVLIADTNETESSNSTSPQQNELVSKTVAVEPNNNRKYSYQEIETIVQEEKRRIGKIDANLLAENILIRLKKN